jgi:hypothetical protein
MDDTPGLTDIFDFSDLPELETVLQAVFAVSFVWILCTLMWTPRKRPQLRSAAVLVLGDVGRSPRMMYHAGSFARAGFETFVVGYEGARYVVVLPFNLMVFRRQACCCIACRAKNPVLLPRPAPLCAPIPAVHRSCSYQNCAPTALHPVYLLRGDLRTSRIHHSAGTIVREV